MSFESGGPLVSALELRGFGTIVMEEMAEHSANVQWTLITLPQA
jgi:hypothetical protein